MKYIALESQEQFRLDRFIIRMYGEYSQYYADVLAYFNPQVDLINLKAGTVLKVPSREEINSITKIRGYYDLSMDSVPRIKVYPKNDAELGFVAPITPPVPDPEPTIDVGINLGEILQNDADVPTTFTIYNDGTADLEIAMVRVPLKYRLTTSPLAVIPMGTSSDFVVSLIDTSVVGVWSGDVIVESNAGSVEFPITAEVVADKSIDVLTFRESIGDVVNGKVLGLLPAEKTWRLADGTTSTDDLVSYISTANGEGRLELTSAGDIGSITELQLNLNGAVYTAVPVTAGLTEAAAEAALVAAGLVLGTSTSSMTDDTAAGLVASSSPEAGTGVAAGSAVDLTVSLGDRHYEIPIIVLPGCPVDLRAGGYGDNLKVNWLLWDGTLLEQLAEVPETYLAPKDGTTSIAKLQMRDGYTIADLGGLAYRTVAPPAGSPARPWGRLDVRDSKYSTSAVARWIYLPHPLLAGDVGEIAASVSAIDGPLIQVYVGAASESRIYYELYGSISNWQLGATAPTYIYGLALINTRRIYGVPQFKAGLHTSGINYSNSTGFTYSDIASTIIGWDAQSTRVQEKTGIFDQYKRSLIGAANPAAEAAIVSLSAKGASWTFLAE